MARPIFNIIFVGQKDEKGYDRSEGVWYNEGRDDRGPYLSASKTSGIKFFLNRKYGDPDDIIKAGELLIAEGKKLQGSDNEPDW